MLGMLDTLKTEFKYRHEMNVVEKRVYTNTVDLINSMVETHRNLAKNGNNKITFQIEKDFPEEILASHTTLKRIVNNFITNSLKHTVNGEIQVKINRQLSKIP